MKIGYIMRGSIDGKTKFEFREATFTRRITSRGDRIYSKLLACPFDYTEIADNAKMMKDNPKIILVGEPFLLDDELREKAVRWVEWANQADPKEYDPFAK